MARIECIGVMLKDGVITSVIHVDSEKERSGSMSIELALKSEEGQDLIELVRSTCERAADELQTALANVK